jgi:hypothetical protein
MKYTALIFPAFFCLLFCSACVKEKNFPAEPQISYLGYKQFEGDSAECLISFKDGDGDVGVPESDTTNDLVMKYLYKGADGVYHPFSINDSVFETLFYGYRIPDITPRGQYKALEGTIKAKIKSHPLYFPGHDAVRFEIRMRDRSGHWSNAVLSDEIHPL